MHDTFSNPYAKEVNSALQNCKKLVFEKIRYDGATITCPNCQTSFKGYHVKVTCPTCSDTIVVKFEFKQD